MTQNSKLLQSTIYTQPYVKSMQHVSQKFPSQLTIPQKWFVVLQIYAVDTMEWMMAKLHVFIHVDLNPLSKDENLLLIKVTNALK